MLRVALGAGHWRELQELQTQPHRLSEEVHGTRWHPADRGPVRCTATERTRLGQGLGARTRPCRLTGQIYLKG
jgi:hypothetical protein